MNLVHSLSTVACRFTKSWSPVCTIKGDETAETHLHTICGLRPHQCTESYPSQQPLGHWSSCLVHLIPFGCTNLSAWQEQNVNNFWVKRIHLKKKKKYWGSRFFQTWHGQVFHRHQLCLHLKSWVFPVDSSAKAPLHTNNKLFALNGTESVKIQTKENNQKNWFSSLHSIEKSISD